MIRPDIAYAVHVVSQFMHAPRTTHLHAVKRIFRYLQGTLEHGLWFRPMFCPTLVVAYSDADWASCKEFCRSMTGYAVFLARTSLPSAPKSNPQSPNPPLKPSTG